MGTPNDSSIGFGERTVPDEIAGLDVEVRAMFERVCSRLGLQADTPHTLGRYEIRGWIANGGMGEVYHAYDTELEREVAIKVVAPRPMSDLEKLRERLRREAKVLAKLDHPNVVSVYDAGIENGRVYLVMQLVTGVTLRERQARKGCTLRERLRLYIEAGEGLSAAHARGIVHRDFKPDNVFVGEDDHARVGDFGLASMLGEPEVIDDDGVTRAPIKLPSRMTRTGELLGTMEYMAPEQLRRQRPDARSDQYAFCVSLWEGVTGVRPFAGANAKALLEAMSAEPRGGQWLPMRLRRALRVGLAPRPEDRHADMAQLLGALDRELGRPKRMLLIGLTIVLGAAASAVGWFGVSNHRAANPECPLADAIATLPASEHWSALEVDALPGTAARFEGYVQSLEADAREACVHHNLALEQQVRATYRGLELSLESLLKYDPEQRKRFVIEFEEVLAHRPTQPLSPEVSDFIEETLTSLEVTPTTGTTTSSEAIHLEATRALDDLARTNVDRAELLLHRGRASSLLGDYDLAVDDFKQARRYATADGDADRRLRASMGAAKTTIMRRTEYIEAGVELLGFVEDELWCSNELLRNPHRAAFLELSAVVARHHARLAEGRLAAELLTEALSLQRRAVLRRFAFASLYELVPALVNLGNIYSDLGDVVAAKRSYRVARWFDPADVEACLGLGRLLVNEDQLPDEARELLDLVLATRGHDLHVAAATALVELELYAETSTTLAERRDALIRLLRGEHPGTVDHQRQGWTFVTLAFAAQGQLGPDFEDARARVPEPSCTADLLTYAQFELALAEFVAADPSVAARFLDRAQRRIEQLPASPARTELLAGARELQRNGEHLANP